MMTEENKLTNNEYTEDITESINTDSKVTIQQDELLDDDLNNVSGGIPTARLYGRKSGDDKRQD